jgi:DNA polymerase III epsilon subunit-like protein
MRVTLCCGRLGRHWTTRQLRQQQLRVERRRLCSGPPPRAVGLAWDLETTGYQPCDIVQIAVTCADWDDEPYSSFVRHVMPSRPIDPRAERIHGISMDLLTEVQAESIDVVLAELTSWLDHTFGPERRLVWAGHNSGTFDLPVLRKCTLAAGCSMPRGLEESAHTVDTLRLARHTLKSDEDVSSHTLEDMYRLATGMPLTDAHDALCDAKAVAAVRGEQPTSTAHCQRELERSRAAMESTSDCAGCRLAVIGAGMVLVSRGAWRRPTLFQLRGSPWSDVC